MTTTNPTKQTPWIIIPAGSEWRLLNTRTRTVSDETYSRSIAQDLADMWNERA